MILVVVGTRPELLKVAPCVRLAKARGLPVHVHCTMQSPDLVDRGILGWDSEGPLVGFTGYFAKIGSPRFIVIQGDTRTAFEAAVVAFEAGIPIFHLEAGVRTYDLSAPWPEEGYRRMISQVATWHACTTMLCATNAAKERGWSTVFGVASDDPLQTPETGPKGCVRVTGSPIVESVRGRRRTEFTSVDVLRPILVTLHRRENRGHFDDILHGVVDAKPPHGVHRVWVRHPNGWAVAENTTSLKPFDPLSANAMADAMRHATVVVTDSGGVQEECNALGVPCVVARTVTDRPESLSPKGGAILGGNTRESIYMAIQGALLMDRSQIDPTIFGDGKASERIVDWWSEILQSSH